MTDSGRSATAAAVFEMVAEAYDQSGHDFFGPIAQGLVEALAPRASDRVLDVGCGRGAVTLRLAAAVLPGGSVTAIDLSPTMVRLTREALDRLEEVRSAPEEAVGVHVMDAASPDLPGAAYDVVAGSLVLFFLPDPVAALRDWRALLRPGGRVGVSTFGAYDDAWMRVDGVLQEYLPVHFRSARLAGSQSPFASDAAVEGLLRQAGFAEVRTRARAIRLSFKDAEDWRRWSMSTGQYGMWRSVPEEERPRVFAAAAALLEECRGADGAIHLTQNVRYTTGVAGQPPAPGA